MGTLILILWLLAPSMFFFYRHIYNWHGALSFEAIMDIGIGLVFLLFLPLYIWLVVSLGFDELDSIRRMSSRWGGGFALFYVFPSIAFALAAFPKVVKDFLVSTIGQAKTN